MSLKDIFNSYQNDIQKGVNDRAELDKYKPKSPWPELMAIIFLVTFAWYLYSIYQRDMARLDMFKSELSKSVGKISYVHYSRYAAKIKLNDEITHYLKPQDINCLTDLNVLFFRRPPAKELSTVNNVKLVLNSIDVYFETRQYRDTLNINGWIEDKQDNNNQINFNGYSKCKSDFLTPIKNS